MNAYLRTVILLNVCEVFGLVQGMDACMYAYKQFIALVVLNIYRIACLQLSFLIFLTDFYFLYSCFWLGIIMLYFSIFKCH